MVSLVRNGSEARNHTLFAMVPMFRNGYEFSMFRGRIGSQHNEARASFKGSKICKEVVW